MLQKNELQLYMILQSFIFIIKQNKTITLNWNISIKQILFFVNNS